MSKYNLSFINTDLFVVSYKLPSWMDGWIPYLALNVLFYYNYQLMSYS